MNKSINITLLAVVATAVFSSPSSAYLDPGTGSLLLQSLIGAIAAAALFGRTLLYKIKVFFGLTKVEEEPDAELPATTDKNENEPEQ